MKTLSVLTLSLLLLSACKKEDLAPKLEKNVTEKIMGKWTVQRISIERTVDEVSYPLPLRSSKLEILGTADDYFDFQANERVEMKNSQSAAKNKYCKVWNPSQVIIGAETWQIEKLTGSELELKLETNYGVQHLTCVTRVYSRR